MDTVDSVIVPRTRELGDGFQVRRVLPSSRRRMVGPFIFFDQMGPVVFRAGQGLDVRPHPHIGLATLTYLFEGELVHRDSLGTVQAIRPGAVNWMTAGRGIAHSERTPPGARNEGETLYGIQCWLALPLDHEEIEPNFVHHPAEEIPLLDSDGVSLRVIAGALRGAHSPVRTLSGAFCVDAVLDQRAQVSFPAEIEERAIYVLEGEVDLAGIIFPSGQLVLLQPGDEVSVRARSPARVLLLGGRPMDGPRHIWWNFVSSSRERLQQAKADWKAGRFPPVVGDDEFIPLPEEPPQMAVAYP